MNPFDRLRTTQEPSWLKAGPPMSRNSSRFAPRHGNPEAKLMRKSARRERQNREARRMTAILAGANNGFKEHRAGLALAARVVVERVTRCACGAAALSISLRPAASVQRGIGMAAA